MKRIASLLLVAACGGGTPPADPPVRPERSGEAGESKESPAVRTLSFEPFRHEAEGVVIEIEKPVDWYRASHLGPSFASFIDPESSESQQSNFGVSISCQGFCDTKAENVARNVDETVAAWEQYEGYKAKFLTRESLPGGGIVVEIEFDHATEGMIYFYERVHAVGDALPYAWCKVQAAGTALTARDQLKAACDAMRASPAGK